MNSILVRHHAVQGVDCPEVRETAATVERIVTQSVPRFSSIGISLAFEAVEHIPEDTVTAALSNLITFETDDGVETPLEDIIQQEGRTESCACNGETHLLHAVVFEEQVYRAVPPGLVADALLRLALDGMGLSGGCGGSCSSCGGCAH